MADSMELFYDKLTRFIGDEVDRHDPMEIAAVLSATALRIYRTALTADEYDSMVDAISDSRHRVKTMHSKGETLQ